MTKYLLAALAVLAVAAAMLAMHFRGSLAVSRDLQHRAEERAAQLDANLKASEAARAKEHAQAEHFNALAGQYEQEKADAQAKADRTIAELRAGNLRLRDQWATQRLASEASSRASQPDAAANGCSGVAVDLFRAIDPIVQRQDAQIRGLQEILKAERQQ
jgi:hypothetical protein